MADPRSPVDEISPELRELAITTSIDRTTDTPPPGAASDRGSAIVGDGSAPEVVEEDRDVAGTASPPPPPPPGHQTELAKHVDTVLKSEVRHHECGQYGNEKRQLTRR